MVVNHKNSFIYSDSISFRATHFGLRIIVEKRISYVFIDISDYIQFNKLDFSRVSELSTRSCCKQKHELWDNTNRDLWWCYIISMAFFLVFDLFTICWPEKI